ncbi:NADH-quinone oxidoreductase subunit G [Nocardioides yefusunii]|uniref:NADH-quinone oxidoreductase n=1 Tax=Nocardioides yefusunii TaxID=2500546 RepID=A0ABW1QZD5_9ACTN|nr:NADH-quinone oxidoreductase subunit G [Nocardioides yefusunii]
MTASENVIPTVTLTIDGVTVTVPQGTLVIRAAEQVGIEIPRFCDHPLLAPAGACRQCLVEVATPGPDGTMRQMQGPPGRMKPQASCTLVASEGMEVRTQHTSPGAEKAQRGVMELLLINHPLDCPVCDKGGECPLQNQAMSVGRSESRFADQGMTKRTFEKPIPLSPQILLDRERCIVCQRCTRFADEVAGDAFISLVERGAQQQIGIAPEAPFLSYFAGNTVQICPVGALTSVDYRFRARPFDLVSTESVAEHDACGAAIRVDHRRGKVVRRLAGNDPAVNTEWISDKDRFAFSYTRASRRITHPWVRDLPAEGSGRRSRGELRPASWPEAIARAATALQAGPVGVLTGGRMPVEDAFAWSKFARTVLRTDDVDFRSRPHSAEEAWFLSRFVAGRLAETQVPTYADLEAADTVVLVGLDPEDEAGTLFLRLRTAVKGYGTRVVALAPFTTRGLAKLDADVHHVVPGREAALLATLDDHLASPQSSGVSLGRGDVVLVGERLATSPGALVAVTELVARTGARLAWVPRRAGDRGAVEAGLLPGLLPGGRHLEAAADRALIGAAFGDLPEQVGRDLTGIVAAARAETITSLLVGGVDPDDTPDPSGFRTAVAKATHVVSLELAWSDVALAADVVLPVAPVTEREGTFLTWDARERGFEQIFDVPGSLPEWRVLSEIATALGRPLGWENVDQLQEEIAALGGAAAPTGVVAAPPLPAPDAGGGHFVLATHRQLVDHASLLAGQDALLATMRPAVVAMSTTDLDRLGVTPGDLVDVAGDRGAWTLPCAVADLPDGVVWIPTRSHGRGVWAELAAPGQGVDVRPARVASPVVSPDQEVSA